MAYGLHRGGGHMAPYIGEGTAAPTIGGQGNGSRRVGCEERSRVNLIVLSVVIAIEGEKIGKGFRERFTLYVLERLL